MSSSFPHIFLNRWFNEWLYYRIFIFESLTNFIYCLVKTHIVWNHSVVHFCDAFVSSFLDILFYQLILAKICSLCKIFMCKKEIYWWILISFYLRQSFAWWIDIWQEPRITSICELLPRGFFVTQPKLKGPPLHLVVTADTPTHFFCIRSRLWPLRFLPFYFQAELRAPLPIWCPALTTSFEELVSASARKVVLPKRHFLLLLLLLWAFRWVQSSADN